MKGFYRVLLLICLGFVTLAGSAAGNSINTLGIPPQDEKYFLSERIKCKDGSKAFSQNRLNDDFCDCPDGTDEPGTSACPEGKFYCRNVGHTPVLLFSSRVNDGICDCCDGSDEYDGQVKCSNTCWEAGRATRDKLKKKLKTYKEGFGIRKQEVEHAKQMMAKEKAELASLKQDEKKLKNVVDKLKETKEAIEKAEEEERLKREKEEQRIRDAEKQTEEQERLKKEEKEQETLQSPEDASKYSQHLFKEVPESTGQDGNQENENHLEEAEQGVHTESTHDQTLQDSSEEEGHKEKDDTEGLSKEELGRLVASRWTGEYPGQQAEDHKNDHTVQEEHDEKVDDEESKQAEEYDDYSSEDEEVEKTNEDEDDEPENKYDEEDNLVNDDDVEDSESYLESTDTPDLSTSATLSWWGKLSQGFQSIMRAVKLSRVSVDMSEAARVLKDYNDLSRKLSKMQSRISTLEKKLKQDHGNDGEFYTFYDQCFEHKENKYTYKICPYKEASQIEGHSTTTLGRWGGFKDSYRSMEFTNGDKCWNGPDRSMTIRLKCGLRNELVDVDEPSRCEYVASLLTPALCLEERLKELERRLELLNQENQTHDEL
uniref:Glucosidase 2 subunit beta n=1 Tax=Araucaria cunninghamii TaxID=56994 RepID=A0A0D6QX17_ARACU